MLNFKGDYNLKKSTAKNIFNLSNSFLVQASREILTHDCTQVCDYKTNFDVKFETIIKDPNHNTQIQPIAPLGSNKHLDWRHGALNGATQPVELAPQPPHPGSCSGQGQRWLLLNKCGNIPFSQMDHHGGPNRTKGPRCCLQAAQCSVAIPMRQPLSVSKSRNF